MLFDEHHHPTNAKTRFFNYQERIYDFVMAVFVVVLFSRMANHMAQREHRRKG